MRPAHVNVGIVEYWNDGVKSRPTFEYSITPLFLSVPLFAQFVEDTRIDQIFGFDLRCGGIGNALLL